MARKCAKPDPPTGGEAPYREFSRLRRRSLPRKNHRFFRDSLKNHLVVFAGFAVAHFRGKITDFSETRSKLTS
ncbi:MAG: hypothetical protein II921_07830 [Treponema sp.]|nr:hypothetical protein [Treponema sp.]